MIGVVRTGPADLLGLRPPAPRSPSDGRGRSRAQAMRPARHWSSSQAGSYPAMRAGRISVSQAPAGASNPSSWPSTAASASGPSMRASSRHPLPGEQEAQEVARRDRLDLGAQPLQRVAVDARQQAALAPLVARGIRREAPAQRKPFRLQAQRARRRWRRARGRAARPARPRRQGRDLRAGRAEFRPALRRPTSAARHAAPARRSADRARHRATAPGIAAAARPRSTARFRTAGLSPAVAARRRRS